MVRWGREFPMGVHMPAMTHTTGNLHLQHIHD
jgi:hypothetical protein